MRELLFQVTRAQLETGMHGYPVGYCPTSFVDPNRGLFYSGISIREVAEWRPESILYLLLKGQEGTWSEVEEFALQLSGQSLCNKQLIESIYRLPRHKDPMKLFSIALLLFGLEEKQESYRSASFDLIAKLPHLAAAVLNHAMGWGPTPVPDPEMGYIEAFVEMLALPNKSEELLGVVRLVQTINYDHGGGSLPAFIGKGVASSLADLYQSLSAAISALSGAKYSRSLQDSLSFPQQIVRRYGAELTAEQVREFLREGDSVPGFGHTPLSIEDPCATLLYEHAKSHFPHDPLIRAALLLREEAPQFLRREGSNPHARIDAILGPILVAADFPYPEAFSVLIGMARLIGICAQIIYEREEAIGGHGTPMLRPSYFYRSRER